MRGEYRSQREVPRATWELPPRARRIHTAAVGVATLGGTTSACAENTFDGECEGGFDGNYLRVRGEYCAWRFGVGGPWELPPRARRIPSFKSCRSTLGGTTSACAENTVLGGLVSAGLGNYLRVRGEYALLRSSDRVYSELPPRARRIQSTDSTRTVAPGTTSACAENTNQS